MMGWQSKFLSQGGKEVMLKAIAMALPTYTMSCFRLPKTTCKQLAGSMADFWWKTKLDSKGLHWRAWDKLSRPKGEGGLGFRDIEDFNTALLGKQLWRILTRKDSLLARLYKSRYFHNTDCLNAKLGARPSYAWRAIQSTQKLLKAGTRVEVGNGNTIDPWKDQWLGSKPAHPILVTKRIPLQLQQELTQINVVGDLLESQGREWQSSTLHRLMPDEVVQEIKAVRPGGVNTVDSFTWDYSRSGSYTAKSAYWLLRSRPDRQCTPPDGMGSQPSLNPLFLQLWKIDAPPKLKHFMWKCLTNCLPVAENLAKRHLTAEALCQRCSAMKESVNHVLFKCSFARLVWAISGIPHPQEGEWSESEYTNLYRVMNLAKENAEWSRLEKLTPWILWRLWKNRNELVFNGKEWEADSLIRKAREDADEWDKRRVETEEVDARGPRSTGNSNRIWTKPPHGWMKCNTDGAWSNNKDKSGIGWVLRNHEGKVLWIGARAIPITREVFDAEAEAMRWAMVSLASWGYEKVIFESDSKNLVDVITGATARKENMPLIQDLRGLLHLHLERRVVFSGRGSNQVADRVAKQAINFEHPVPVLFSIVPSWVKHLVVQDVCNSPSS